MICCRQHNIKEVSLKIAERLQKGESCALITDAGMPCISDPGAEVVNACRNSGLNIEVIPGPSALIAALALSGFECRRFSFEGFLSVNPRQRRERLSELKNYDGLLILYEAPHKLLKTLADLLSALGDRKVAVCRELTKIHEEVLCGSLSEMLARFENIPPRGEFVLVIEAPQQRVKKNYTLEEAVNKARGLIESGQKTSEACKNTAKETGLPKSSIYKELTTDG